MAVCHFGPGADNPIALEEMYLKLLQTGNEIKILRNFSAAETGP